MKPFPLTDEQVKQWLDQNCDEWLATISGARHYLTAPIPSSITLGDISRALSMEPRFAGQTKFPWPVGAHSIIIHEYGKRQYSDQGLEFGFDLALGLLLHDAAEFVLKDIPKPLKNILGPIYKELQRRNTEAIYHRFGVNLTSEEDGLIHKWDMELLLAEAEALGLNQTTTRIDEWAPAQHYTPADLTKYQLGIGPVDQHQVDRDWMKMVEHYL